MTVEISVIFFQNYPYMIFSICLDKPPLNAWVLCKHPFAYTDPFIVGQEIERTQNVLTVWSTFQPWSLGEGPFHCLCGHAPQHFRSHFPDRGQGGLIASGSLRAERGTPMPPLSILCSLSILRCRAAGCASPACKAVYLRGHTLLYPEDSWQEVLFSGRWGMGSDPLTRWGGIPQERASPHQYFP